MRYIQIMWISLTFHLMILASTDDLPESITVLDVAKQAIYVYSYYSWRISPLTPPLFIYHYGFTDSLTQNIRIHYHHYAFWCSNGPSLISASTFKPTRMLFWHAFIGCVLSLALRNKSCFTHFTLSLPHT